MLFFFSALATLFIWMIIAQPLMRKYIMTSVIEEIGKGEKTVDQVEDLYEKEFSKYLERHEKFNWIDFLWIAK